MKTLVCFVPESGQRGQTKKKKKMHTKKHVCWRGARQEKTCQFPPGFFLFFPPPTIYRYIIE